MHNDPEYAQKVHDLKDVKLDFLESMAHKRVNEGSDTMIIFLLKTQGKDRGYIERTQVENKEVSKFGDMSDEELDGFIEASKL